MLKLKNQVQGIEKTHTLIHFFATWCSPCQTMEPIVDRIENEFTESLQVLKIDVDLFPKFAQHFMVQNVPTFVLIKAENVVWKKAGIMTFTEIKKLISENV